MIGTIAQEPWRDSISIEGVARQGKASKETPPSRCHVTHKAVTPRSPVVLGTFA
jgi:hypothetical protein